MRYFPNFRIAVAAVGTCLLPMAAVADAIDGTWCSPDGARSMQIHGPRMVTPGGHEVIGEYSRHAAAYDVPEGEAGAGKRTLIQLLSEDEAIVKLPEEPAATWLRCQLNV